MRLYNWNDIKSIIFELKIGKAAIVDTDTLKGIIAKQPDLIYKIKKRSPKKKLIIFISDLKQIPHKIPSDLEKLIQKYWPGPLTIIIHGVSYRMPNYEPLLRLIKVLGPIYSSSANISNFTPVKTLEDIKIQFSKNLNDLIVIESQFEKNQASQIPSTIFDYDHKMVLRQGSILESDIYALINSEKKYIYKLKNFFKKTTPIKD